jgi:hypothetical protein
MYIFHAVHIWRILLKQAVFCAVSFAAVKTGNSIAARIAMIAMTTSSSISVKPFNDLFIIYLLDSAAPPKPAGDCTPHN